MRAVVYVELTGFGIAQPGRGYLNEGLGMAA